MLLPADERTAEVAPRLAERLGGAAVVQATAVTARDGRAVWTKPVFGGKALAEIEAAAEPVVATLRRGSFPAPDSDRRSGLRDRPARPRGGRRRRAARPRDAVRGELARGREGDRLGRRRARRREAFRELEELAGLLGGAVGASLAAVDAGWAPPERQVGLTGKAVSPDVYFALGISGASQHLAGIGGAKAVVAVNTDPEAPIFTAAKLGVVMDARAFVASMIEQLRSGR